jgi:uncharacterized protein YqeY
MKGQIQSDLTEAMRARDELKVATLRMAIAAIQKAEVAGKEHAELSDADVVAVLRSELKKRNDAAEMYETGGRADRAEREHAEAAVLAAYLPPSMDDDALAAIVAEEAAAVAPGQVVKAVRARVGDAADGARIATAVKAALGVG